MQEIINNLTEEQKRDLINALYAVDEIIEEVAADMDDDPDYYGTQFYEGMYDVMRMLGQWC